MHFVYGFCNGNTTAAVEEYRLRYPRRRIPDRRVFTRVHQHLREKGSFPSVNRHAERQVQRSVEDDEHNVDMVQLSPSTSTRRISARLRIPRMTVWRTLFTEGMYPYHIQRVQHLEPADMCSQLDLCRWINSNPRVIRNVLLQEASTTLQCFVRLQVLWSHESENVWKQMEDTSKIYCKAGTVQYFSTVM